MNSNIENLDDFKATLESFKELKSGISGSRIKKMTAYAMEHVSEEVKLMDAIIAYSRECADTHKLGSLYIIDSIGRAYLEEARARDDYIKPKARLGSCAHGVYTLGEAIQELLVDGINKSDAENKEKIRMLIDIWDRSGLFQKGYLNAVRAKCFSMDAAVRAPPPQLPKAPKDAPLPDDPKERAQQILENLSKYSFAGVPTLDVPNTITSMDEEEQGKALEQLLTEMYTKFSSLKKAEPVKTLPAAPAQDAAHRITAYGSRREREKQSKVERSRSPRRDAGQMQGRNQYQQQSDRSNPSMHQAPPANQITQNQQHNQGPETGMYPRNDSGYNKLTPNKNFGTNNHHLYPEEMNVRENPHFREKVVSFDPNLPPNTVKVFSRTLFIGGLPMHMNEWDLARLINPFGEVQSVILNHGRKHAFVKVYSRREAENAFANFNRDGALPLRTRWGVGFGPRDCCDYQHGFSVIPLHRLTDADKKWSVAAQWGGTGGQPLVGGVVYEEPDITVGEGISSKSMSQKMPTDSNANGPTSKYGSNYPPTQPPMFNQMNQMGPQQGMYTNQMPTQPAGYPGQNMMPQGQAYPPQGGMPPQVPPQSNIPPAQPQQQGNVDPAAQLNSLMNMLSQQQQQQQQQMQ